MADRLSGEAGGEIVNADAMQLYRGMDIGTAKLPVAERRGIPHHQLDVLDVTETATVARYQRDAAADVERISAAGAVPIIVGGSMMYVQSLLDEWAFPATDPGVRAKWELRLAEIGAAGAARGAGPRRRRGRRFDPGDRRQAHRAGARGGGADRKTVRGVGADHRCATVGHCHHRIGLGDRRFSTSVWQQRTDKMFADGLVDEVAALLDRGLRNGVTASRALGYAQVIAALDDGGDADALAAARERTFIGTRRYVRRQRSWFRRDHRIVWLDGAGGDNVEDTLRAWRHVS